MGTKLFTGKSGRELNKATHGGSGEKVNGRPWKEWQSEWDAQPLEVRKVVTNYALNKYGTVSNPQNILRAYSDMRVGNISYEDMVSTPVIPTEAEAAEAKKDKDLEDYINTQKDLGETNLAKTKAERADRRSKLATQLAGMRDTAFKENVPGIQEGLSSQGLLHSSALGTELAKEQGRLQTRSEELMNTQELSDLDYEQMLRSGILGEELATRTASMNRDFSLQDWSRNAALAREIAKMQADSADKTSKNNIWSSLIGAGSQLGTAAFLA
jgi:hypothetical protein